MKAVIYARYSSELQSARSIEDQVRICREHIDRQGWTLVDFYKDSALSGTSNLRPEYQRLLGDARLGRFDVVVAESLDRLSRDQEHVAHLFKHLSFCGVRLLTLSEGIISELHVGLSGTMGALYIKQLAEKTRRGLRGRIEAGKSGGGLTYGYDVVRTIRPDGTFEVGGRKINVSEAAVVHRIFEAYASGMPPRKIAWMLNAEGIPGPRGKGWSASTINGNAERGTGILNNPLYIGRLVWNKLRYLKDPTTGKRRSRMNDQSAVVERAVPELRLIDEGLWARVKARQAEVKHKSNGALKAPWDRRRPRYLLSGLVKCGACGAGYVLISSTHMGCAAARNKGTCRNRLSIGREALERTILDGLGTRLLDPALFKEFCVEFIEEVNRLRQRAGAERAAIEAELSRVRRRLRQIVDAIGEGAPARTLRNELLALEAREDELTAKLAGEPEPKVLINPRMAEFYRARVADLQRALAEPKCDDTVFAAVRALIDSIVLTPINGKLAIDLHGDIAAILQLSSGKPNDGRAAALREQLVVVAGAGFEPTTFRL